MDGKGEAGKGEKIDLHAPCVRREKEQQVLPATTVVVRRGQIFSLIGVLPRNHLHVIGHERRDLTLEDGRVALYDEDVVHLSLEVLVDDWNREGKGCG